MIDELITSAPATFAVMREALAPREVRMIVAERTGLTEPVVLFYGSPTTMRSVVRPNRNVNVTVMSVLSVDDGRPMSVSVLHGEGCKAVIVTMSKEHEDFDLTPLWDATKNFGEER